MNIEDILSEIDAEIVRLQQVKAILGSSGSTNAVVKRRPGRPPASAKAYGTPVQSTGKRRTMSPEGRARIAAAQKARWAKTKRAGASVGAKKVGRPAKKSSAAKKSEAAAAQA